MLIGVPESFVPTLATAGFLFLLMPWTRPDNPIVRPILIAATLLLTWRYLIWRLTDTLPAFGFSAEWFLGAAFFSAELLTSIGATITWIVLARTRSRSHDATENTQWSAQQRPPVDVLICTYNESRVILERTIIGATAMDYPNYRVWVLDDGKREWLRELCEHKGCRYLRRADNSHAKAGNINNALRHLVGLERQPDFIAVLDADFVPFSNFLSRTVPLFRDPSVGIVQTPQHFFNSDPIQSNLSIADVFPDEQRFFFEVRLREHGHQTVYLNEKLSAGLAPEGLREYAVQRARWCLGLVQIIRGPSSPFSPRNSVPLSLRIGLLESFLYWGASFPFKIVCLLAPLSYLLLDLRWVDASLGDAISHFAPMFIAQIAVMVWLGGGRMLPVLAEVYQLLIALEITLTVAHGLIKPMSRQFKVTAKGIRHAGLNIQWRLLGRFATMPLLTILGTTRVFGVGHSDLIQDGGAISIFWSWYNLTVLTLCCFICFEQPRRRLDERFVADHVVVLTIGGVDQAYKLKDISAGGLCLSGGVGASVGAKTTVTIGAIKLPGVIARKANDEFAVKIVDDEARETLTRHVYSERYGKPIDYVRPIQVLVHVLHRIVR
jgi:cellulose synthase/poly-beta-1,6-N-acetylglucosamine synthase-like glycosyltransferase